MRAQLLERLRCPGCAAERSFALDVAHDDGREVREGALRCQRCAAEFAIREGIAELLRDAPDYVTREAAGLDRFAELMRADGWNREQIRALPYVDLPYWWGQRRAFEYWAEQIPFAPGEWLLDLGSNTCWASAMFAERGLEVVALDIATTEMQGLATAEYFIDDGSMFFERVLSTMARPAIASGTMDYIFCCEALHHNSLPELRRTLRECFRVLKPGGTLLLVNEPLRFPLKLKRDHGREVAEFDGNEHVYFLHQYVLAARSAGFSVSVRLPRNAPRPSRDASPPPPPQASGLKRYLPRTRLTRQARAAWKMVVAGDVPLNMRCDKPS